MRKVVVILALMGVASSAGCASKATAEDCQKACENVATVALADIDRAVAEDEDLSAAGETGRELAQKQAKGMLETIRAECIDECTKRGSQKQAQCLANAKTMKDLQACK